MPTRPTKYKPVSPNAATDGPPVADGLIGVFRTLAEQHAEAAQQFDELRANIHERATLWPLLRTQLVSHEHSEVRELYPVLRQYEATRAFAEQHDAEARELDALIARLDQVALDADAWSALFETLVATVLQHARDEEEAKIFPVAQRAIGEVRALELDAKLRLAHQKLAEAN